MASAVHVCDSGAATEAPARELELGAAFDDRKLCNLTAPGGSPNS